MLRSKVLQHEIIKGTGISIKDMSGSFWCGMWHIRRVAMDNDS